MRKKSFFFGSDRIRAELLFSVKKQLRQQDQQEADGRGSDHFAKKIDKRAKIHPFQQYQISMMKKGQHDHIRGIGRPSHTNNRRGNIVLIRPFLGNEQADDEGAHIGDEGAGGGMQAGCFTEIIKAKPENEGDQREGSAGQVEWQPEHKQEIKVRGNKPVEGRHLEKDEHLHEDEQYEPDTIFQQFAHWVFLRVESSILFCSSYCRLSITYTYSMLKKLVEGRTFKV